MLNLKEPSEVMSSTALIFTDKEMEAKVAGDSG